MAAATFPKPITEGNLPFDIKYRVKNPDGSISTVRTMSIGVDGGEVVIPTVLRGRVVSDEEAIRHFEETGANFGTFRNPEEAKAFSEWLHNKHAAELAGPKPQASAATFPKGISGNRLDHITMMAESGGNPNAVSPKGARGLMQVMPATARAPGFGIRPSNGSPADDVRVGKEYRRVMQARYGGDPAKMWAAYNWGPGALDKAIASHGERWLDRAPSETRNYVSRNLRALRGR